MISPRKAISRPAKASAHSASAVRQRRRRDKARPGGLGRGGNGVGLAVAIFPRLDHGWRAMMTRRLSLIALALALPALIGLRGQCAEPGAAAAKRRLLPSPRIPVPRARRWRGGSMRCSPMPMPGETYALLAMQGGRIVAERYAPGYGRADALCRLVDGQDDHRGDDRHAGFRWADAAGREPADPAWQRPGDPRGEITVRQLLQMRSGLRHTEAGRSDLCIGRSAHAVSRWPG